MIMMIEVAIMMINHKQRPTQTNKQTGRSCSSSSVSCVPDFSLEATRYTWSYTRSSYPSYCCRAASIAAVQWGLELLDEVQDTMMIPPLLLMMMMIVMMMQW